MSAALNVFHMSDRVSDTHGVLSELLKMEAAFLDLLLFVQIVLTVLIVSATAEHRISTMKRAKTYLRSRAVATLRHVTGEKNGIGIMTHELVVESQYLLKLQSGKITQIPCLVTAKFPR